MQGAGDVQGMAGWQLQEYGPLAARPACRAVKGGNSIPHRASEKVDKRPAPPQRTSAAGLPARLVDRLGVALATQSECDYSKCDRDAERRAERAH